MFARPLCPVWTFFRQVWNYSAFFVLTWMRQIPLRAARDLLVIQVENFSVIFVHTWIVRQRIQHGDVLSKI